MRWNPFINADAAVAAVYIWGIALLFRFVRSIAGNTPDSIVDPIGALSLLVFSVALMGFLFFYRPVMLLVENKKAEAISYFLKTLGIFGAMALLAIMILSLF
ncbi:MAG: hypothetical protein NTV81_03905 [Candidatus Komeilibacteria bacterium]|nr:hypothetical protein [Candidatus Komeilibacteria bacterium]